MTRLRDVPEYISFSFCLSALGLYPSGLPLKNSRFEGMCQVLLLNRKN